MEKQELVVIADSFMDVGIEMSEAILDSFLTDGVFKEIPILNIIISGFKAGKQYKDVLYMKKLAAFIFGFVALPKRTDKKVSRAIEDADRRKDLGESILLIIDRVDSVKKADLSGRVFALLKNGDIESSTFLRLCHMIDKTYYDDLLFLKKFKDVDMVLTSFNDILEDTILEELFSSGWLSEVGFDGGNASGTNAGTRYRLNQYGKTIIGLLGKGE